MDNPERELANKDEISTKNWKVVMLEVKLELDINGVTESVVDCRDVNIATVRDSPDEVWGTLEGKLIDMSDCDGKDEEIPEEVALGKKLHIEGNLGGIPRHWKHSG